MRDLPRPWGPHDGDAFAALSARLTGLLRDYLETIRERPVRDWKPPGVLLEKWNFKPSDGGEGEAALLAGLHEILADSTHLQHPRYAGHQVSAPVPAAALLSTVVDVLNPGMAVGDMAPAASILEAALIRWLGTKTGLPEICAGYFTGGGTEANLVGMLAARNAKLPESWRAGVCRDARPAILVSEHAHYSVTRAAAILGLGSESLVVVPESGDFRMTARAARETVAKARAEGRAPFFLSASAGCTATGTIDELDGLAELCAAEGLWFHVDGAHGASLALNDKLAPRLKGIERADSLAWDPHKLMSLPLGMGAVITRDRDALLNAFRQNAPYIFHSESAGAALPNPGEISFQCSRPGDALKLWGLLVLYGEKLFSEMVALQCGNAEKFHALLEASDDFAPLHRPDTNIVCFQHRPAAWRGLPSDELGRRNYLLHEALNRSGAGWITSTVLNGQRVLRCTFMNPATTEADLAAILDALRRLAPSIA